MVFVNATAKLLDDLFFTEPRCLHSLLALDGFGGLGALAQGHSNGFEQIGLIRGILPSFIQGFGAKAQCLGRAFPLPFQDQGMALAQSILKTIVQAVGFQKDDNGQDRVLKMSVWVQKLSAVPRPTVSMLP